MKHSFEIQIVYLSLFTNDFCFPGKWMLSGISGSSQTLISFYSFTYKGSLKLFHLVFAGFCYGYCLGVSRLKVWVCLVWNSLREIARRCFIRTMIYTFSLELLLTKLTQILTLQDRARRISTIVNDVAISKSKVETQSSPINFIFYET